MDISGVCVCCSSPSWLQPVICHSFICGFSSASLSNIISVYSPSRFFHFSSDHTFLNLPKWFATILLLWWTQTVELAVIPIMNHLVPLQKKSSRNTYFMNSTLAIVQLPMVKICILCICALGFLFWQYKVTLKAKVHLTYNNNSNRF